MKRIGQNRGKVGLCNISRVGCWSLQRRQGRLSVSATWQVEVSSFTVQIDLADRHFRLYLRQRKYVLWSLACSPNTASLSIYGLAVGWFARALDANLGPEGEQGIRILQHRSGARIICRWAKVLYQVGLRVERCLIQKSPFLYRGINCGEAYIWGPSVPFFRGHTKPDTEKLGRPSRF